MNAIFTLEDAASTWNCSNCQAGSLEESAQTADTTRLVVTAITARKAIIATPTNQSLIERRANVSILSFDFRFPFHDKARHSKLEGL